MFLNETCKDAMNLSDFTDSFDLQLSDLETVGELGYVEGISQIFIDNLSKINKHDRPIHCSDYKRETLYIKSENQWIKETEDKTNIKNAIKQVANKKSIINLFKNFPSSNRKFLKLKNKIEAKGQPHSSAVGVNNNKKT